MFPGGEGSSACRDFSALPCVASGWARLLLQKLLGLQAEAQQQNGPCTWPASAARPGRWETIPAQTASPGMREPRSGFQARPILAFPSEKC